MSSNGWLGKPGVPLNPERDGWHWLSAMYYDDPIGPPIVCFWYAEHQSWPRLQDKPGNQPVSRGFCYLGPILTPAEMDARVKQARRNALEEAAKWHDEKAQIWQNTYAKETLSGPDMQATRILCLERGGLHIESAAAIRALGEKE